MSVDIENMPSRFSRYGRRIFAALLHTKASLGRTWYELSLILKWPFLIGLLSFEGFTVLIALWGIFWANTQAFSFGIPYLVGFGVWASLNSPILYLAWRKIKEEDSKAKIMTEAWESRKDTKTLVKEYQDLCEKKKKRK